MAHDEKQLQGEGNREADRHYREGAQKHAQSEKSKAAAEQAREAVEKRPVEMDQAERRTKTPAKDEDPEVRRER